MAKKRADKYEVKVEVNVSSMDELAKIMLRSPKKVAAKKSKAKK